LVNLSFTKVPGGFQLMASYSRDDLRAEHRRYWRGTSAAFLKATSTIKNGLGLSIADLHDKMFCRAGATDFMVDPKTLTRWLETGNHRAGPSLSNLCVVIADICNERESELTNADLVDASKVISARADGIRASDLVPSSEPGTRLGDAELSPSDLKRILEAIPVPQEADDPKHPEFPPHSPRFPATPMIRIEDASCALYVKDESQNPTGNHKDRWAWEQLLLYRERLEVLLEGADRRSKPIRIPRLSMISSGTGAYALQVLLRLYGLPSIKVLVDLKRTPEAVKERLRLAGASVYSHDLDEEFLGDTDVRRLTFNEGGTDITTRDLMKPHTARFYDWLVCEILTLTPKYIFLPVGTGELFVNIITFLESLANSTNKDDRLVKINHANFLGIHVLGATAKEPRTAMNKLYAKFPPIAPKEITAKIDELKKKGILGRHSSLSAITDEEASVAMELAQGAQYRINTELSGMAGLGLFLKRKKDLGLRPRDVVVAVNTGWLRTT